MLSTHFTYQRIVAFFSFNFVCPIKAFNERNKEMYVLCRINIELVMALHQILRLIPNRNLDALLTPLVHREPTIVPLL